MAHFCVALALALTLTCARAASASRPAQYCPPQHSNYTWQNFTVSQRVDHFDRWSNATFQQRLLVSAAHAKNDSRRVVLLYTGNEGGIEGFAQATGLMWELAPTLGALLVFAEHRGYGASTSPTMRSHVHLNSEQKQTTQGRAPWWAEHIERAERAN